MRKLPLVQRLPPWLSRAVRRLTNRIIPPVTNHLVLRRTTRTRLEGLELVTHPGVFPPNLFGSTRMMARHLSGLALAGQSVAEMGTGSGALALVAAARGARAVALDLDPAAVACAAENARRNGLSNAVEVHQSDLFAALPADLAFDYIVFNPPHFPRSQAGPATCAWHAGEGFSLLRRFADQSLTRLRPGGRVVLALSSDMDVRRIVSFFTEHAGVEADLVLSVPWLWETYHLYHFGFRRPRGSP
jgi:release factor glutamine methyltransferase